MMVMTEADVASQNPLIRRKSIPAAAIHSPAKNIAAKITTALLSGALMEAMTAPRHIAPPNAMWQLAITRR